MTPDSPHWAKWTQPHRVFLVFGLMFGLALCFVTPPFQIPDEPGHFFRAYQISEGQFRPIYKDHHGGADLPSSLDRLAAGFKHVHVNPQLKPPNPPGKVPWAMMSQAWQIPLESRQRRFIPAVHAIYSPIPYLPQAAAIFVGRQFELRPLALMYLGRVCNLLAWVLLCWIALRISPTCHRPLLLLLLMPMTLFQAASLSGDAMTIALPVLLTAMVLRYAKKELVRDTGVSPGQISRGMREFAPSPGTPGEGWGEGSFRSPTKSPHPNPLPEYRAREPELDADQHPPRLSPAVYITFLALAATLALCKFVYLPLLAMVSLIPKNCFGGPKRYLLGVSVIALVGLTAFLAWTLPIFNAHAVLVERPDINPAEQIHVLRTHPSHVVTMLASTVSNKGWAIARSFVGRLGWLDTPMHHLFTDGYLLLIAVACWLEECRLATRRFLLMLVVSVPVSLSVFATILLNYIYVTPVGKAFADGVQGRYLIPLAPAIIMLLCSLPPRKSAPFAPTNRVNLNLGAMAIAVFSGIYTIVVVSMRYYGRQ